MSLHPSTRHIIKLTTHPSQFDVEPEPIRWAKADPHERGPVVATVTHPGRRNAVGAHSGTYSVYRAVALAAHASPAGFRPDFTNTLPPCQIGPHPAWSKPGAIVSLDPWGHLPQEIFAKRMASGELDVRPTISVTRSHLDLPEIKEAVSVGRLTPDAKFLMADGAVVTTKAAIEPVWHLPGVARRFGADELRSALPPSSPPTAVRPPAVRRGGEPSSARAVRAHGWHVPGAGDAGGPRDLPAADQRAHHLHGGRCRHHPRPRRAFRGAETARREGEGGRERQGGRGWERGRQGGRGWEREAGR